MGTTPATALAEAASRLKESARTHKQSEFAHRKQARALMQELARLEQVCAQHGITLTVNGPAQEA